MKYFELIEKLGSVRKAATSLGLSKTQFCALVQKELGLCVGNGLSCKSPPEEGKTRCRKCLTKISKSRDKDLASKVNKAWREKNAVKVREKGKQYYWDNHEKMRKYYADYYSSHDQKLKSRLRRHKRRTLERADNPLTAAEVQALWDRFGNKCFRCGSQNRLEIDHVVPLSKGGTLERSNCSVLCKSCNSAKRDVDPNKFFSEFELLRLRGLLGVGDLSRRASQDELMSEFQMFRTKPGDYLRSPNFNKITTHFQPHFYAKENELWKKVEVQEKLAENRRKYLGRDPSEIEVLRGFKVSGLHWGFSHHSPFWIKAFLENFKVSSVYDPCGGWGHRLLGAVGYKYVYNDSDPRTLAGIQEMVGFFGIDGVTLYNNDATTFTPPEDYEAVFTCPPYHDREIYDNSVSLGYTNLVYKDWLSNFWRKLIKASVKPSVKYFCFIISKSYAKDLQDVCLEEGLKLEVVQELGSSFRSHLNKDTEQGEVLVIMKPGK